MNTDDPFELQNLIGKGIDLPPTKVKSLERQLERTPDDFRTRALLLGFYERHYANEEKTAIFIKHFIWMIENRPEDRALASSQSFVYKDENFRKTMRCWFEAIRANPNNTAILNNAAKSATLPDMKTAEKLLKRAQKIEPLNEEWPRELSHLYSLGNRFLSLRQQKNRIRKAMQEGRKALELHAEYPKSSYLETYLEMVVSQLADLALKHVLLDDAAYFGQYLIDLPLSRQRMDKSALKEKGLETRTFVAHLGHSILGRVASIKGDVELAKAHLRVMPKLGNPLWKLDLKLAQELLSRKERVAVIEYLQGCSENLSSKLRELETESADPYRVPALILIRREEQKPLMSLTNFMRADFKNKISQIENWKTAISQKKKITLPEEIW